MKEEHGKEWVKHLWSTNGRRGRAEEEKEGGAASEVPSNFPAVVVTMVEGRRDGHN